MDIIEQWSAHMLYMDLNVEWVVDDREPSTCTIG